MWGYTITVTLGLCCVACQTGRTAAAWRPLRWPESKTRLNTGLDVASDTWTTCGLVVVGFFFYHSISLLHAKPGKAFPANCGSLNTTSKIFHCSWSKWLQQWKSLWPIDHVAHVHRSNIEADKLSSACCTGVLRELPTRREILRLPQSCCAHDIINRSHRSLLLLCVASLIWDATTLPNSGKKQLLRNSDSTFQGRTNVVGLLHSKDRKYSNGRNPSQNIRTQAASGRKRWLKTGLISSQAPLINLVSQFIIFFPLRCVFQPMVCPTSKMCHQWNRGSETSRSPTRMWSISCL